MRKRRGEERIPRRYYSPSRQHQLVLVLLVHKVFDLELFGVTVGTEQRNDGCMQMLEGHSSRDGGRGAVVGGRGGEE